MALAVNQALAQLLTLEVVGRHLGTRGRFGIGDVEDKDIHHVVATHLGSHCQVTDDDVLLLLHIVIIVVAVGVAPFAVVAVFLIVVGLAVPVAFLAFVVDVHQSGLHLVGGEGVVGWTEVEAQLIHGTRLHLNIIGEHDGESLPLVRIRIVDGQTYLLLQTTRLAHTVSLGQFIILQEREDVVVKDTHDAQRHAIEADGIEINGGFVHIGDDHPFIGPAHLGLHLGEVEGILKILLQHHAVFGTDAAFDTHCQLVKLVTIEVRLVEVEVNVVALDIGLITQVVVSGDEARQVLRLLQGLAEGQGGVVGTLVDIEAHRDEEALGIDG